MPAVPFAPGRHWHPVANAMALGGVMGRSELRRRLLTSDRCWVFEGIAPVFIKGQECTLVTGFVVVRGRQQVVWAYTRPRNQGSGIMVALLDAAGIDTTTTMQMLTRTPVSDAIVADLVRRGWKIEFNDRQEAA